MPRTRQPPGLTGYWPLAKTDPKSLLVLVADMAPLETSAQQLLCRGNSRKRLYGKGARFSMPLTWIEEQLAEQGSTTETLVQSEMQQQAADQVSISNTDRKSPCPRRERLEGICREYQSCGTGIAHRPIRTVCQDGLFHSRRISPYG